MTRVIKLIAIDLDGTLLDASKRVAAQTAEAIACTLRRSTKVVIASARPPRSVRAIYRSLGLDTLQINYNGALIWDEAKRLIFFHQPMTCDLVREMIDHIRRLHHETLVSCEIADRWFTDRDDQTYTTETGRLFKPDHIGPVELWCHSPITKLMFLGSPVEMTRAAQSLQEHFGRVAKIMHTDPDLIQIMHPDASKADALKQVAANYGVSMDSVMAIGDAINDIEMIRDAGVGVAMDNARPEVKAVADWVAPSNVDHGVYAALKHYGLCD